MDLFPIRPNYIRTSIPTFETDIIKFANGFEQRSPRYSQSKSEFQLEFNMMPVNGAKCDLRKLNWRGAYVAGVTYRPKDLVSHGTWASGYPKLFRCDYTCTSVEPTNPNYWFQVTSTIDVQNTYDELNSMYDEAYYLTQKPSLQTYIDNGSIPNARYEFETMLGACDVTASNAYLGETNGGYSRIQWIFAQYPDLTEAARNQDNGKCLLLRNKYMAVSFNDSAPHNFMVPGPSWPVFPEFTQIGYANIHYYCLNNLISFFKTQQGAFKRFVFYNHIHDTRHFCRFKEDSLQIEYIDMYLCNVRVNLVETN